MQQKEQVNLILYLARGASQIRQTERKKKKRRKNLVRNLQYVSQRAEKHLWAVLAMFFPEQTAKRKQKIETTGAEEPGTYDIVLAVLQSSMQNKKQSQEIGQEVE